jgi:hypothetical protein
MCSPRDNAALPALGFPIRRSAGHRLLGASPRLIAAAHVLHRLLVPRHPPCALHILTVIDLPKEVGDTQFCLANCAVFKVRRGTRRRGLRRRGLKSSTDQRGPVSQNSTACVRNAGGRSLSSCAFRLGPVDIPKAAGAIKQTDGAYKAP